MQCTFSEPNWKNMIMIVYQKLCCTSISHQYYTYAITNPNNLQIHVKENQYHYNSDINQDMPPGICSVCSDPVLQMMA